jgi:dTDP-glucose 4,6-dehydratase
MKAQKVAVTGGAGFIGSALVRELVNAGADVLVYDNFIYGTQVNLEEISSKIHIEMGDVLSWRLVEALQRFQPDYVFHLAAEPYIPKCYENPEKFLDVNIKGTLNVLMACKLVNVQRMVHFSTSEVYGTAKSIPMDESHPTLPLSTYAVSKLAADRLCFVFSKEHKIPVVIIRPFNSYGPRETQPYVIPEIISQLAKGNRVRLGNIKAQRDFTYVHDLAQGAIAVMQSDVPSGEVVNIGSNRTYSVEEVTHTIGKILGRQDLDITIDKTRLRPLDVNTLQCDYSKVQKYAGWRPRTDLEDGLKRTVRWFLDNGKQWSWEAIPSLSNANT